MKEMLTRKILPNAKDFKEFWKDQGPFRHALTAADYPPVLLAPEEWIFANDIRALLDELMGFSREKMALVKAPFSKESKVVLRPEALGAWKIKHFPEDWNGFTTDIFTPEGHLTLVVEGEAARLGLEQDSAGMEAAFFTLLEERISDLGYTLLSPSPGSKWAAIQAYVREWEADEADAGIC